MKTSVLSCHLGPDRRSPVWRPTTTARWLCTRLPAGPMRKGLRSENEAHQRCFAPVHLGEGGGKQVLNLLKGAKCLETEGPPRRLVGTADASELNVAS